MYVCMRYNSGPSTCYIQPRLTISQEQYLGLKRELGRNFPPRPRNPSMILPRIKHLVCTWCFQTDSRNLWGNLDDYIRKFFHVSFPYNHLSRLNQLPSCTKVSWCEHSSHAAPCFKHKHHQTFHSSFHGLHSQVHQSIRCRTHHHSRDWEHSRGNKDPMTKGS